jgi:hypothetical protein
LYRIMPIRARTTTKTKIKANRPNKKNAIPQKRLLL